MIGPPPNGFASWLPLRRAIHKGGRRMKRLGILLLALAAMLGTMAIVGAPAHAAGKNCTTTDFPNQKAAQDYLRADPSDPDGLDGPIGPNNDTRGEPGVACESLPCPCDRSNVYAQAATTVPQTVATTSTTAVVAVIQQVTPTTAARVRSSSLASSGPSDWLWAEAAFAVLLIVAGSQMRSRRPAGAHYQR